MSFELTIQQNANKTFLSKDTEALTGCVGYRRDSKKSGKSCRIWLILRSPPSSFLFPSSYWVIIFPTFCFKIRLRIRLIKLGNGAWNLVFSSLGTGNPLLIPDPSSDAQPAISRSIDFIFAFFFWFNLSHFLHVGPATLPSIRRLAVHRSAVEPSRATVDGHLPFMPTLVRHAGIVTTTTIRSPIHPIAAGYNGAAVRCWHRTPNPEPRLIASVGVGEGDASAQSRTVATQQAARLFS